MTEGYEELKTWTKETESGYKWVKTETYEEDGDWTSFGSEEWIETPTGKKIEGLEAAFTEIAKGEDLGTEQLILTSSETCKHEKNYVVNHQ
jgi:hypothetical protein